MSKDLTPLKKGIARFQLVGRASISDFTFKTDVESQKPGSDWIYNQMNLGVDCGKHGVIYSNLMGGYGSDRQNVVYVHGKKDDNGRKMDDFKNQFTIDWDDRLDEDLFENIGDMCFITVGIEVDTNDRVVYKKFLSPYDAVEYLKSCLKKDTVVNVRGNLKWQEYNGKITCQKEITSITLSKTRKEIDGKIQYIATPEEDFKATFTQTLLVDGTAIGKPDKETMTLPLDAYVVDHVSEYRGQRITRNVNGKIKKGTMLPLLRTFEFEVDLEDKDRLNKMLRLFKTRGKKVLQITVDGYFSTGAVETVAVTTADIPSDIQDLIDAGYINKEDVLDKVAYASGGANKPEKMFISNPYIKIVDGQPIIDRELDLYVEDDITADYILEAFDTEFIAIEQEEEKAIDIDKAVDTVLDAMDNDEEEEEDWLAGL